MQQTAESEAIARSIPCGPTDMTDSEAVRRAQNGDSAAFEHLYLAHSRRVYALCLRMTSNPADAEELTQEAFLCVFRKIHTFRGDAAFSTWLHRLATNIVLMRLRKKTVSQIPLQDSTPAEPDEDPARELGSVDLVLKGAIDRMLLDAAIAQLPPGYKQAFVLHDVLGFEHAEIAAISGHSIGNSKSQLHKARVRLRKLLQMAMRRNRCHAVEPAVQHGSVCRPTGRKKNTSFSPLPGDDDPMPDAPVELRGKGPKEEKERRALDSEVGGILKNLGVCTTEPLVCALYAR